MRTVWILRLALAATVVVGLGTGCGTSGKHANLSAMRVVFVSENRVEVDGETVALSGLGRRLKAAGAKAETPIEVAVPASASAGTLRAIAEQLSSAGYRRLVFAKPRHANVSVSTP